VYLTRVAIYLNSVKWVRLEQSAVEWRVTVLGELVRRFIPGIILYVAVVAVRIMQLSVEMCGSV
jgi:hypothetical protein